MLHCLTSLKMSFPMPAPAPFLLEGDMDLSLAGDPFKEAEPPPPPGTSCTDALLSVGMTLRSTLLESTAWSMQSLTRVSASLSLSLPVLFPGFRNKTTARVALSFSSTMLSLVADTPSAAATSARSCGQIAPCLELSASRAHKVYACVRACVRANQSVSSV
jgi:hypothetical protein